MNTEGSPKLKIFSILQLDMKDEKWKMRMYIVRTVGEMHVCIVHIKDWKIHVWTVIT